MGWSSKYLLLWCLGEYSDAIFYTISNLPLNNLGHKPSKLQAAQWTSRSHGDRKRRFPGLGGNQSERLEDGPENKFPVINGGSESYDSYEWSEINGFQTGVNKNLYIYTYIWGSTKYPFMAVFFDPSFLKGWGLSW